MLRNLRFRRTGAKPGVERKKARPATPLELRAFNDNLMIAPPVPVIFVLGERSMHDRVQSSLLGTLGLEGSVGGFLIWIRTFDGALAPQLAFDTEGGRPYLDRGIRSALACWTPLTAKETALPLDELARRYPPGLGHMLADREAAAGPIDGASP